MAIQDEAFAMPVQDRGNDIREQLGIGMEVGIEQLAPFLRRKRMAKGAPIGCTGIHRTHTFRSHHFLSVIGKAFGIDDEATQPIHEERATQFDHWIEEEICIPVRHAEHFLLELVVVQAQGVPDVGGNEHRTMRDMDNEGDGTA